MSLAVLAGVGLLGGVGAVARVLLGRVVALRLGRRLPWGTLAVNLSGTFALGVLVGAAVSGDVLRLAGTGLLGAYTTFSTWMLESHREAEEGRRGAWVATLLVPLVLGLAVAVLGRALGRAL